MNNAEARKRLGISEGANRREIKRAYDRIASLARTDSADGRKLVANLAEARDVLLASNVPWLDTLSSSRSTALQGLAALGLSLVALLSNANLARISIFAPIVFALGAWLSFRQRRRVFGMVLMAGVILATALVARAYSAPRAEHFSYNGDLFAEAPPFQSAFIPLTADPGRGAVETTVEDDPTNFDVACTRDGVSAGGHAQVQWAYISSGDYETLWIPVSYLNVIAAGEARALLPCSDWRWLLQNVGEP